MTDKPDSDNADEKKPEKKSPKEAAAKKAPKFLFPGAEEKTSSPATPALSFPSDQDPLSQTATTESAIENGLVVVEQSVKQEIREHDRHIDKLRQILGPIAVYVGNPDERRLRQLS